MKAPGILVIYSDKSELEKVSAFLTEIFTENHLSFSSFNKVLLCVSEAVINSIEHGNQNDRNKLVTIKITCEPSLIHVQIQDEGKGFNFSNIENPILTKNLKKESGRGIYIIKSLSDSLIYNEKGNEIQLKIECK
jgi:serine/threonine-protein kinase RsbW